MKKNKLVIISIIILALIIIGITITVLLFTNNNSSKKDSNKKDEISNYILFKSTEYGTIEDVVFYDKDEEIDETLKNNLTIIANELKVKYPNKSILYLRNLGSASLFDAKELYRCMQIEDDQKLDDTEMNVLIKEDNSVEIEFLVNSYWKSKSDTENITISKEQAQQITIDYLSDNIEDYYELKRGIFTKDKEECKVELYKYNSKTSWKMQFSTGGSYLIIDANTGEILYKYFFCGIYT